MSFVFTSHTRGFHPTKKRSSASILRGPQEPIHVLHAKVRVITTDFFLGPVDVVHWSWPHVGKGMIRIRYVNYVNMYARGFTHDTQVDLELLFWFGVTHMSVQPCVIQLDWTSTQQRRCMKRVVSYFFFGWCMWIYVVYNLCIYLFVSTYTSICINIKIYIYHNALFPKTKGLNSMPPATGVPGVPGMVVIGGSLRRPPRWQRVGRCGWWTSDVLGFFGLRKCRNLQNEGNTKRYIVSQLNG